MNLFNEKKEPASDQVEGSYNKGRRDFLKTSAVFGVLSALGGISFYETGGEEKHARQETIELNGEKIKEMRNIAREHNKNVAELIEKGASYEEIQKLNNYTLVGLYTQARSQEEGKKSVSFRDILSTIQGAFDVARENYSAFFYLLKEESHGVIYFMYGDVDDKIKKETDDLEKKILSGYPFLRNAFEKSERLKKDIPVFFLKNTPPLFDNFGALSFLDSNIIIVNRSNTSRYGSEQSSVEDVLISNEIGNIVGRAIVEEYLPRRDESDIEWEELFSDVVMLVQALEFYDKNLDTDQLDIAVRMIIFDHWKGAQHSSFGIKYRLIEDVVIKSFLESCEMDTSMRYSEENAYRLIDALYRFYDVSGMKEIVSNIFEKTMRDLERKKAERM